MTCEKCGHECDGECTNCGGMKPGDKVCPICDLLALPAGNRFVLISDDPPVVINWKSAGDLPVNEVVAAFNEAATDDRSSGNPAGHDGAKGPKGK